MPLDNQQELFIWVDEKDNILGSVSRFEAHHNRKKIHRGVHILLVNKKDQVLLQKRSLKKDTYPGKWTVSAGGHATYPDSYEQAAYRELEEELGLQTPLTFIRKDFMSTKEEQEFNAVYMGKYNEIPRNIDKDEVSEVKWVNKASLKKMILKNLLTPTSVQTLQLLGY